MTNTYVVNTKMLLAVYMQQMTLQMQLIEAQNEIIELQSKLDETKPETPKDEEVFWHISSKGILSKEVTNSQDLKLVEKFLEWNYKLAENHVKPYINPKVYTEVVNQMTRGLSEQVATLKTQKEVEVKAKKEKKKNKENIIQLPLALVQDA